MPVPRSELERHDDAITEYYGSIGMLLFDNPDQAFRQHEIENRVSSLELFTSLRLWPIRYNGSGSINNIPVDVITFDGEKFFTLGESEGDIDVWGLLVWSVFVFIMSEMF